jgi:hypothetical protein
MIFNIHNINGPSRRPQIPDVIGHSKNYTVANFYPTHANSHILKKVYML